MDIIGEIYSRSGLCQVKYGTDTFIVPKTNIGQKIISPLDQEIRYLMDFPKRRSHLQSNLSVMLSEIKKGTLTYEDHSWFPRFSDYCEFLKGGSYGYREELDVEDPIGKSCHVLLKGSSCDLTEVILNHLASSYNSVNFYEVKDPCIFGELFLETVSNYETFVEVYALSDQNFFHRRFH